MDDTQNTTNKKAVKGSDDKMWAMFCHLGGLLGLVIFPCNIIAPFVIWIIFRDDYELVMDQGKEAINYQISFTIYLIASAIMVFFIVGIFLVIGLLILNLIFTIMAAIKTSEGGRYRYPMTIRFIQ